MRGRLTIYIGDIEYENGVLKRIATAEGYVERLPNGALEYHYALKDLQGTICKGALD